MKKLVNLIFISLLALTSCSDDLDINTDPNTPQEINKGLALSAAQGSITTIMGGEFFNLGGMFAQFYTQAPSAGQYDAIDQYNLDTDYANRLWTELYAGALNDLEFVLSESEDQGDTGTYLIATCLRAYTMQYLVDVFGDVPYNEAFQGSSNISPSTDEGEEIYLDLLSKIDKALASYKGNNINSDVGQQDLIFAADMDKWVQFANTLKLKLYSRMSNTDQANSAAVTTLLSEGNFLTENASFTAFTDATSKRNPYYEVQIQALGDVNDVASNSLLEFYTRNNDPRLERVFKPNTEGEYIGIEQGIGILAEPYGGYQAQEFARPDIQPTTPVYLMSLPESSFLQAEAYARYGSSEQAQEKYEEGVIRSFELYGLSTADAMDLISPDGAYAFDATADLEDQLETIINQKWAALANVNNIEAWIETRRTGYPLLVDTQDPAYEEGRRIYSLASVLPEGQIPASIYYPDNEVQRNSNLTQKPNLLQEVWWNQD